MPSKDKAQEKELESFLFSGSCGGDGKEVHISNKRKKRVDKKQRGAERISGKQPPKKRKRQLVVGGSVTVGSDVSSDEGENATKNDEITPTEEADGGGEPSLSDAPAWVDEDDEKLVVDITSSDRLKKLRSSEKETGISGAEYSRRLREQFQKLHKAPSWAAVAESEPRKGEHDSDSEDDKDVPLDPLRRSTNLLSSGGGGVLEKGHIAVRQCTDANMKEKSKAVVRSVQFHSNAQILLTAGLDRTLRFFQIDGKENPKLQSVFFDDMPIYTAAFSPNGREVYASGRRKHFYSYDMHAAKVTRVHPLHGRPEKSIEKFVVSPNGEIICFFGNDGHALMVSTKTKQYIGSMKMNGSLRAASFTSDGGKLLTAGGDGEVYLWDVGMRKCMHRFVDEGAVHSTALAVSPGDHFIATGADSGVVNLYDWEGCLASVRPTPVKRVLNLTTNISNLNFSSDGQVLCMSSDFKKDSLRLLHTASRTVFANWPSAQTPLGYVSCSAFSPHSGYLAIGNDKGRTLLYRLNHYPTA